jgi:hypothetical protein
LKVRGKRIKVKGKRKNPFPLPTLHGKPQGLAQGSYEKRSLRIVGEQLFPEDALATRLVANVLHICNTKKPKVGEIENGRYLPPQISFRTTNLTYRNKGIIRIPFKNLPAGTEIAALHC